MLQDDRKVHLLSGQRGGSWFFVPQLLERKLSTRGRETTSLSVLFLASRGVILNKSETEETQDEAAGEA